MKETSQLRPGERLKEFIQANGLTQTEFAARMGVGVRTLNNIIHGHRKISVTYASMIARAADDPVYDATYWINVQTSYDLNQLEAA